MDGRGRSAFTLTKRTCYLQSDQRAARRQVEEAGRGGAALLRAGGQGAGGQAEAAAPGLLEAQAIHVHWGECTLGFRPILKQVPNFITHVQRALAHKAHPDFSAEKSLLSSTKQNTNPHERGPYF